MLSDERDRCASLVNVEYLDSGSVRQREPVNQVCCLVKLIRESQLE